MPKYVKSIVRDGNNLVVSSDDCEDTIIELCCDDDPPPSEEPKPGEETPPPGLGNTKCLVSVSVAYMIQVLFQEFLFAVDPVLTGLPPYALPFVATWVYSKGWNTTNIAPLTLLLGEWNLEGRYAPIRTAAANFPDIQLIGDFDRMIYCLLPEDGSFSSNVRKTIADEAEALITDPERAVGEFMRLIPIGWLQQEIQRTINVLPDPDIYDCSSFDCGGGESCLEDFLWVWSEDADTAGWLSLGGHSTSEFPGLAEAMGGTPRTITASRVNSPPDRWRAIPGASGVNNPVGVWYSFSDACSIRRIRARGGTGTQNTQLASIYIKRVGSPLWVELAEVLSPLNNKHNPGGTWPIVEYGKPGDGLPVVTNVTAIALIWQTGGGTCQISWISVNHDGTVPSLP